MVSTFAPRDARQQERDFYVWSDTSEKYKEARIIFKDFEPSNWAWIPSPELITGIVFILINPISISTTQRSTGDIPDA